MDDIELVLVSGMSGAGKTQAMAVFENLEYYCMDNYPVALLEAFTDYLKEESPFIKVAMAVRLDDAMKAIRVLSNADGINLNIVFLDCEDSEIVKRYKQTRRSHPLIINGKASTLTEAIQLERKKFEYLKSSTNLVIDTTLLKNKSLQDLLESKFNRLPKEIFRVTFVSFGYKHGIPKDADLVLDVRFLPNPFYNESLRSLTGNDQAVYDYVMDKEETRIFIKKAMPFYDYLLKEYEKEGKMQVTVAIGCTGGQHRSVTLTNYFYQHYSSYYQCYKYHRDADH
ncbi:RNase adaptor protein RapZ [Eggerthia catenaformis]|uniref:RNase adapter RapZ n=1 Tax=Eggerthia catenaformis TaxID=31973 RepID=UPI000A369632|nr:RNase adapter RapZ [Eggerthia catenaformis]OUC52128.1 RNase adaptor protein RapZ [Eggerthia catenaformis]